MPILDDQPFNRSLLAGLKGMAKGALVLGITGLIAGAALGGLLGATAIMPGGALFVGSTAAAALGQMGAVIGTIIGGFTGVVASREVQAPDAQDVINIANISFAQGVAVGRSKELSEGNAQELAEAARTFQDRLAAEKPATRVLH